MTHIFLCERRGCGFHPEHGRVLAFRLFKRGAHKILISATGTHVSFISAKLSFPLDIFGTFCMPKLPFFPSFYTPPPTFKFPTEKSIAVLCTRKAICCSKNCTVAVNMQKIQQHNSLMLPWDPECLRILGSRPRQCFCSAWVFFICFLSLYPFHRRRE